MIRRSHPGINLLLAAQVAAACLVGATHGRTASGGRVGDKVLGHFESRVARLTDGSYLFLTSYQSPLVDYRYYLAYASRRGLKNWRLILIHSGKGVPLSTYDLASIAGGRFNSWVLVGQRNTEDKSGIGQVTSRLFHFLHFDRRGLRKWCRLGSGVKDVSFANGRIGAMAESPLYGSPYNVLVTMDGGRSWQPQAPFLWPGRAPAAGPNARIPIRWIRFISPTRLLVVQAGNRVTLFRLPWQGGLHAVWRRQFPAPWYICRHFQAGALWAIEPARQTPLEIKLAGYPIKEIERCSLQNGKITGKWGLRNFTAHTVKLLRLPSTPGRESHFDWPVTEVPYPRVPNFDVQGHYFVLEFGGRGISVGRVGSKETVKYRYSLLIRHLFMVVRDGRDKAMAFIFPDKADQINLQTGKIRAVALHVSGTFALPSSPGGVLNALGDRVSALEHSMPLKDYFRIIRPLFSPQYLRTHSRTRVEKTAVRRLTRFLKDHHLPVPPGPSW